MNSSVYTLPILATVAVSLLSLSGGIFLFRKKSAYTKHIPLLVSFAAGVMLAATFFDILPEAFDNAAADAVLIAAFSGIVFSFLIERSILWHHHHHEDMHDVEPTAWLVLVGDGIHNIVDGIAIASAFLANPAAGIAATIAIAAHEIPQELADLSVLVRAGIKRSHALILNFLSALTALAGVLIGLYFLAEFEQFIPLVLGFTAGVFIYISCADLIPDLHESSGRSGVAQTLLFLVGLTAMILVTRITPHGQDSGHRGDTHENGHIQKIEQDMHDQENPSNNADIR